MCFSATASFLTATVTGAAGAAAIQRSDGRRELLLASVPLFFAAQQFIEGALWLTLPVAPDGTMCRLLTHTFLVFALLFWPVFAPLAALVIEKEPRRRIAISLCLAVGVGVAAYLFTVMQTSSHLALVRDGHIVYASEPPPDPRVGVFYILATALGPAFSSHRAINALSIVVLAGSVVAWIAYWEAFVSVWCFFAAGASVVILMHFEQQRVARTARATAAT